MSAEPTVRPRLPAGDGKPVVSPLAAVAGKPGVSPSAAVAGKPGVSPLAAVAGKPGVSPPAAGSAKPGRGALERLRVYRRIHVRLTAIYGVALLLVLTPAAIVVYELAVKAELDGLAARLHMATVGQAGLIDGDRVLAIERADAPYRVELKRRFEAIIKNEPEISSLFVFAPTADPDWLSFVVDSDVRSAPAEFGERYNARHYPELKEALQGARVERAPVADAWGLSISGFAPIYDARGKAVAILGIDTDAARVERMRERLWWTAVGICLGAMVLLGLAAIGVGRLLRGPLNKVIRGTEAIADGELSARVGLQRTDEFGVLGRHFDLMASGLQERERIRAMFGRYVSEDVAKKLLADRGNSAVNGEERVVTVLFSDLRGYSTLSEALAPTEVLALMNQYLEAMSPAITEHGGCVIEYLGDGILAVFGAPEEVPEHPAQAVRCALAMRERLETLNAEWEAEGRSAHWQARGIERLTSRIGIHTGRVVAGSLGSHVRMKYAILGDTVNLAARLEGLNSVLGTDVIVSDEVLQRLPPELAGRFAAKGEHFVKGRVQAVRVHAV